MQHPSTLPQPRRSRSRCKTCCRGSPPGRLSYTSHSSDGSRALVGWAPSNRFRETSSLGAVGGGTYPASSCRSAGHPHSTYCVSTPSSGGREAGRGEAGNDSQLAPLHSVSEEAAAQ
eukprot:2288838-Prymnesium_polylepis.4